MMFGTFVVVGWVSSLFNMTLSPISNGSISSNAIQSKQSMKGCVDCMYMDHVGLFKQSKVDIEKIFHMTQLKACTI